MGIATSYFEDEFVNDSAGWVVQLSNGTKAYQDDNRPGESEPSAWKRLKTHLENTGLTVTNLGVKFRSHEEWINQSPDGWYFSNGVISFLGGRTFNLLNIGMLNGDDVTIFTFKSPELILQETDIRPFSSTMYSNLIFTP